MAARFNSQKSYPILFEAIANLPDCIRSNIHLHVCGEGCDDSNLSLIKLLQQYELQSFVSLYGIIDHMPTFYSKCHYTILASSFGEAFPNVLVESMSCGVPVIATDVGDSAMIVSDCGFIVPPSSSLALTNQLISACSVTTSNYIRLSQKSRERVVNEYSLSSFLSKHRDLYTTLIQT